MYAAAIRGLRLRELQNPECVTAVRAGLGAIIPLQLLTTLSPLEMELRTCGLPYINLEFLKVGGRGPARVPPCVPAPCPHVPLRVTARPKVKTIPQPHPGLTGWLLAGGQTLPSDFPSRGHGARTRPVYSRVTRLEPLLWARYPGGSHRADTGTAASAPFVIVVLS